ncbi:hypothetical protein GCM10022398_32760 [Acetobacter lovaniensis]|nr:hypothetical protein AA0474_3179 [Acetobacter lovaniensis NRIC 0474]
MRSVGTYSASQTVMSWVGRIIKREITVIPKHIIVIIRKPIEYFASFTGIEQVPVLKGQQNP